MSSGLLSERAGQAYKNGAPHSYLIAVENVIKIFKSSKEINKKISPGKFIIFVPDTNNKQGLDDRKHELAV
jgi:hypothetical protein